MSAPELKEYLQSQIVEALHRLGLPEKSVQIETSKVPEFGDLSSNIALVLTKEAKKPPLELAEQIKQNLDIPQDYCSSISVSSPGFINFTISIDYLRQQLAKILQSRDNYGRTETGQGKTANVEFVSANPTGPLTVGHGRQAVLGDIIANILEWHGYQVVREYYFNDAGRQMRLLGQSVYARYMELLGESSLFPEGGYQGGYIRDIAKIICDKYGENLVGYPDSLVFKNIAVETIFEDIKITLEKIGITFDNYVNEKTFYDNKAIDHVVSTLREKNLAYNKDGAVWFRTSKLGKSQDTVLIKNTGEPTYRLPDIAYHQYKIERNFDLIVDIFGADHKDTYPDVLTALKSLGFNIDNIRVLIHQFVTLKERGEKVKMSTRKATFVTLDELIDRVGPDVVRYFFIMRNMQSHLNFDLELATKESDENPVYYLQYAHARICNIIKYGKETGLPVDEKADLSLIKEPSEIDLMKELIRFPRVAKAVLDSFEPQILASYLQSLATHFHKFYAECRVVTDNLPLSQARMALVTGIKVVLANGLRILGISRPERM